MIERGLLVGILAFLTLSACGSQAAGPAPPAIRYGVDVSEHGMIVSEERFAAAALPPSGPAILFDDTGELFLYRQSHGKDYRALYVHDFKTRQWLRAEDAWYLLSERIPSPMGWGLVAYATEAAARDGQAEWGGQVLDWAAVSAREWKRKAP